LLRDALWHPRTDQAPDGNGLLIGKSLNDAVELGAGLKGGELFGHGKLLRSPPKVHLRSTTEAGVRAVLVGSAARSGSGYTSPIEQHWIEAIRRQADLEGLTYTQIVNEVFRQYFEKP
jgi:hypothetical protein